MLVRGQSQGLAKEMKERGLARVARTNDKDAMAVSKVLAVGDPLLTCTGWDPCGGGVCAGC